MSLAGKRCLLAFTAGVTFACSLVCVTTLASPPIGTMAGLTLIAALLVSIYDLVVCPGSTFENPRRAFSGGVAATFFIALLALWATCGMHT